MKIGIVQSGGDCAGLNTVFASIVKAGTRDGHEFIGYIKGWEGILDNEYVPLTLDAVRGISHLGGTILKTTNKGRFAGRAGAGDVSAIPEEILQQAYDNVRHLGVDCLIVLGGDGTLSAAMQLSQKGVPIVGVPKTMDNDLSSTDQTVGFSSAVDVVVESLDRIHTTATSHDRVFFVECMGRHAGWITLHAGLAANANMILLPEFSIDIEGIIEHLRHRLSRRGSVIVAVAEGIQIPRLNAALAGTETKLEGSSQVLMSAIESVSPGEFEMRAVILGHTQRGGSPNVEDRILAKRYGIAAYEACKNGQFGHMISYRDKQFTTVPIVRAGDSIKRVTKETPEYIAAQKLGVYINE
jgi:ATP-dependent phosphofructokinase / diphosphate-dependent phosphofructokinase